MSPSSLACPKYPKIETLLKRDPNTHKVIPGEIRLPEFGAVNRWLVTEKIDGTNIRVHYTPASCAEDSQPHVHIAGRTDRAQLPPDLLAYLQKTFTIDRMYGVFDAPTTLYGEGYGPKIQKGGGNYRSDVAFRLFDIRIGQWWLVQSHLEGIANALHICTAPILGILHTESAVALAHTNPWSVVAQQGGGAGRIAEGIVARSEPLLFTRKGDRVMWKLKGKDFSNA